MTAWTGENSPKVLNFWRVNQPKGITFLKGDTFNYPVKLQQHCKIFVANVEIFVVRFTNPSDRLERLDGLRWTF